MLAGKRTREFQLRPFLLSHFFPGDAVVGTVATDTTTARQASESRFGERFWGVVTKVAVLLKLGKTALELEEGVRKFLH